MCVLLPSSEFFRMTFRPNDVGTRAPLISTIAVTGLVAVPFLFPFAAGPSANVCQQLTAWTCLAGLLAAAPTAAPARAVVLWLAVAASAVSLGRGGHDGLWLTALLGIAGLGLSACIGAGLAGGGRQGTSSCAGQRRAPCGAG
jgi:hypothetical protein